MDSSLREFDSVVVAGDEQAHAVALAETAFFPTGGGQPHDTGALEFGGSAAAVVDAAKGRDGLVWHTLAPDAPLPRSAQSVHGAIDWERRYLLMRIHTAQHISTASSGSTTARSSPAPT